LGLEVTHLARLRGGQRRRVEGLDRPDAAAAFHQDGPRLLGAGAQRRGQAHARHEHAAHSGTIRSLRARVTSLPSTLTSLVRIASFSSRDFKVTLISIVSPGPTPCRKPKAPAPPSRQMPPSDSSSAFATLPIVPRISTP